MSNEAWNKVKQTHELFKKIISPLKQHLRLNFGYMIVFNDGRYYQIIEDLDCLKKWVTNVETSHIFCARNVTNYFDGDYNFTIWPEEPTCSAMDIYKEYGIWNGITVSKINKNYTELYWFTKENAEDGWHRWFIRNKLFLIKFIKYFKNFEDDLHIKYNIKAENELFKFAQTFNYNLYESEHHSTEFIPLIRVINILDTKSTSNNNMEEKTNLSPREVVLLSIISEGYTTKMAAKKMNIAPKTAEHYIENIKKKTCLNYKNELIEFYKLKIIG